MRLPSAYMFLTTTALLVTSSMTSPAQLHLTAPDIEGSEPLLKGNLTALKSDARSPAANDDEQRIDSPPGFPLAVDELGKQKPNLYTALRYLKQKVQLTTDSNKLTEGSTRETKLLQILRAKAAESSQRVPDAMKVVKPAVSKTRLSDRPVEELWTFLDDYNRQTHPNYFNPAKVLRSIYTEAKMLEAIVKAMKSPKKDDIAAQFKDAFTQMLLDDMMTTRDELKLLKRNAKHPQDSWLSEAFVPYKPHYNIQKLKAWCMDGLMTLDMIRLLYEEPTEVSIQDGSLLRAFATYIGLLNTSFAIKKLTLFEALTAHYGDNVVARMGTGKYSGYPDFKEFCSKLGSMQTNYWLLNEQTPHNIFHGLKLHKTEDYNQLVLFQWVKFVDQFNLKRPTDAVTPFSVMKEFYPDDHKLAQLLSMDETDSKLEHFRVEQAKSWLRDFKSHESVFQLLHLDFKDISPFQQPLRSWLAFVKLSSEHNPEVTYHSIKPLAAIHGDIKLAEYITKALRNPNTVEIAAKVEDDLIRTWFNELKTPEDIDLAFRINKLFSPVPTQYKLFYIWAKSNPYTKLPEADWRDNFIFFNNDLYNKLPIATKTNMENGMLLYKYAKYVDHCSNLIRVEPLDLFALLRARFGAEIVVEILVKGLALVKSKNFSLKPPANIEDFARAVSHVQNRQIQDWLEESKLPGDVFIELGLDTKNSPSHVEQDLLQNYVDTYYQLLKGNAVTSANF